MKNDRLYIRKIKSERTRNDENVQGTVRSSDSEPVVYKSKSRL